MQNQEKRTRSTKTKDTTETMEIAAQPNPDTLAVMLAKYGPLMDFANVAAEFKRKSDRAIRVALARRNRPPWAEALHKTRVRHGHRVFFRTRDVALIIERDMPPIDSDDE